MTQRINVLDQGWVESTSILGDEALICAAARTSNYVDASQHDEAERNKKLLTYLYTHKHTSPFEHVIFQFRVRAPVIVAWQWVRHRTWSFNFQSGRYMEFPEDVEGGMYVPEKWRAQAKSNKQASDGELQGDVVELLNKRLDYIYQESLWAYQDAIAVGVAREQARLFLPGFAMYYTFVATVDAHNLMRFLQLRMSPEAQFEIRQYANAVFYQIFKPALPHVATLFAMESGIPLVAP